MKKSSTMETVNHINSLIEKNPSFIKRAQKLFLIFDEVNNPYLAIFMILNKPGPLYGVKVYKVNGNIKNLKSENCIGEMDFELDNVGIFLRKINVVQKKNSNKGLGTEMLAVLQMLGDSIGVKYYSGAFGNFSYLDKKPKKLENFYFKNNFIFPDEFLGSTFEKTISVEELDGFKRQTINYPVGKNDIIVIIPEKKIETTDDFNKER